MAPPTNADLNAKREQQYISITPERKYYRCGNTWMKRSLRPIEWQQHDGYIHVPMLNTQRVLNEGACLKYLAERSNIPLPKLYACFEDDGAACLVTEYVEGVGMNELNKEQQQLVTKELKKYLATLKTLRSDLWGGPDASVLPPYRVMRRSNGRVWRMRPRKEYSLVFCHNDLSANNYGGFFPPEFERKFYTRPGPSIALAGEVDDVDMLVTMIEQERL
ncbi:kinase-like domain protein [Podospora fimiseda]|uniref:Kinase-like domain protein n=1 Tax=Podospora fimiseda TaxID=252190 RepID=A0AAN7BJ29_9PEZI|nr:kinase-like domain protein [Podospora fimiseda]